jgi:DNA-directed RNA polymerase subunit RPC12/RpoP
MSELVVNCPKCSKGLKLRDRSKIGKKARCPKCSHVFVLTAPPEPEQVEDEVELKLATDVAPQPTPQPEVPAVGVAARWVPDNAPPLQQAAPPVPPQPVIQQQQVPQQATPQQPAAGAFFETPAPGPVVVAPEDAGGVAHLKALKKKNAKRRNTAIVAGLLTAAAVGGVVYMAQDHLEAAKLAEEEAAKPKVDEEFEAEKEQLRQNTAIAKASSPTTGGPIPMNCLPLGARVIISVRPAELWKAGSRGEEVRFCLGPFGEWATAKLTELCQFEPAQIEHALIGIIPGEVGEPPQVAAVVRLIEAAKKSELLVKFGGERNQDHGYPMYVRDDLSFLIGSDLKMIAVAPSGVAAEEMASSVQYANPQSDGIDALLPQTDADRHLTLIFEPRSVVRHRDTIFPQAVWQLIDRSMEFFNDEEVETVAWSMHFGDKKFHSELMMRNQTIVMEHLLQAEMRKKLKQLPFDLVSMVERMNPGIIGPRKVIGRFPAMTQVFAMSTTAGTGTRYAQLTTELPERAAPNLALGGLLAWDESTRTDFNTAVKQVKPEETGPKLPDLVVDRLKKVIDVEFVRTPLQDAFAYIADECKVDHYIDGDALKLSAYTKNMAQDYVANCSGLDAIKYLVTRPINGQPNALCIVIQQDQKRFLLTTKPVAKESGLTIYEFE